MKRLPSLLLAQRSNAGGDASMVPLGAMLHLNSYGEGLFMKQALVFLSLALALVGVVMPSSAKAESSFSFSISDGDSYRRPHYDRDFGPRHHHWRGYRPQPVFYAPPPVIYAAPVRPVVYQPVIVQQAPQYISSASVVADQASPTYYNRSGQLCREYQTAGSVGGSRGQLYGTACLQPDGSWRVVD